jgi:hypothetical protein
MRTNSVCLLVLLLFPMPALSRATNPAPPSGVPDTARVVDAWDVPHSNAWALEDQLFLVLMETPSDERVTIPRLANVVKRIHWLADPDMELKIQPEPSRWIISATSSPKARESKHQILVLTLDAPPIVFRESIVTKPDAEGILTLAAKNAVTHGDTLRFEPQPHKNTVGYWSNEKDTAEWHYALEAEGDYEIDILQGCGKGHGGSTVELKTDSSQFRFEVQETGHFQNFIWRTVGTAHLKATEKGSLRLVPAEKAGGAVMDVRAVRLVPRGEERSFKPELADPASLPAR